MAGGSSSNAKKQTPAPQTRKKGQEKPASKKSKGSKNALEQQPADLWPARMYKVREWGHKLQRQGGSHQGSTNQLLSTLKDGRILTEQSLRRTALEALTPAASVGHRGALAAQANALMDSSKVVRETALDSLWEAAGHQRPEEGGAVHAMLAEVIPPHDARYKVESRRAAADALARLAPKGDQRLLTVAREWLDDEDAEVRCSAAQAAGFLGEGLEDVKAVSRRLKDPNWRVGRSAVDAVAQLSGGENIRHRCKPKPPPPEENEEDVEAPKMRGRRRSSVKLDKTKLPGASQEAERPKDEESSQAAPAPVEENSTAEMPAPAAETDPSADPPAEDPELDTFGDDEPPLGTSASAPNLGEKRRGSVGKARRRSSAVYKMSMEESDEEDPDGMPRPSAAHLAATSALSFTITEDSKGEYSMIRGLPRIDAVAALRRTAPWGDDQALEAVGSRLRDTDSYVRQEAIAAVKELEPGDHFGALRVAAMGLTENDWRARGSAAQTLVACCEPGGDSAAFELAAEKLEWPDWGARRGAVAALRVMSVAEGDGPRENTAMALEAVNSKLSHEHWSVRRKAVVAIASICEANHGDLSGLKMIKEMSNDPDEEVRIAVAAALPRTAPKKTKEAVLVALKMAQNDEDVEVKLAALQALKEMCGPGKSKSREAVTVVADLLKNENEKVRTFAQKVLRSIGRGRRTAIDALAEVIKTGDARAKQLAAEAYSGVADYRSDRAQTRTNRLLRHPDEGVRLGAQKASTHSAVGQDDAVIAAAAAVCAKFRRDRFSGLRGNALSDVERLLNIRERGEDPDKDTEWLELFGAGQQETKSPMKDKKAAKRAAKSKKAKSNASSSQLTSRATSEAGEDSTLPDSELESSAAENDDAESHASDDSRASKASRRSGETASSRQTDGTSSKDNASSKSSMTSGMQLKGKQADDFRRMKAEAEKEKKRLALEKKKRQQELMAAMADSDEEELSESNSEDDNDDRWRDGPLGRRRSSMSRRGSDARRGSISP